MFNTLTETLIRLESARGVYESVSLPEAYARLMADLVDAFPALRPHQRHPWHAFLVQLGAMAMHRAGLSEPPDDAEEWLRIIQTLTPDWPGGEPWQLVVEDITQPAFMQPAASSADKLAEYKTRVATPDELDMLVTAKNHDLKSAVAAHADVDDWIFALVTLQTMEGYGGAGNYGISRMNGGMGSRPAFTLAPPGGTGAHVRRDIAVLVERRSEILEEHPNYRTEGGAGLLWTLPWDGTSPEKLSPSRMDPFFIELCRRVRLRPGADGHPHGIRVSSKAARIESKALKGKTGDPWVPVNLKENKSLTMAAGGFTYKRVTDCMTSGDWEQPVLLKPTDAERRSPETMRLVARAMVRGQGKTEGYYERVIPIRSKMRLPMGRRDSAQELGEIAQARIEQIGLVQRILSHSIQVFAARGDRGKVSPEHRRLALPWLNRLDEIVDERFFDHLQDEFEADATERQSIREHWLLNGKDGVVDLAKNILRIAEDTLPCPTIHRYRARANADSVFEGRMRGANGMPFLYSTANKEENEWQGNSQSLPEQNSIETQTPLFQ